MPVTRQSERRLEMTVSDVETYKQRIKAEFNQAVDDVLDNEISNCCNNERGKFAFTSYIRGLYYLTFAKYFNPLAYRMAWQVLKKLQEKDDEMEGCKQNHQVID
jgi:hypothetical protein